MSFKQTFAAFAAAVAVTVTAVTSTALAQAADQALGIAIMSALINADGSGSHAAGVTGAEYDSATQTYTVGFNRPLIGCAINVTPWNRGFMASAEIDPTGHGNTAIVALRSHDNAPAAGAFHLIAFCGITRPAA